MGWTQCDWFTSVGPGPLNYANGNICPTAWWRGELVGSGAVAASCEVRVRVVTDRGS